jgi:streptogramin lyase
MEDLAGNGWKAFSGVGANILVPPPRPSGTMESANFVSSVYVDSTGKIYMTTTLDRPRLVRIDDMDGAGWTTFSPSTGGLKSVVVDRQGRIYFSDNANHWITRIDDMQGRGLVTLGALGTGVNQFNEPEGLTIDSQGRIYVADETNHRIVRFNDMTGAGWTTFGTFGNGTGQLKLPHDVQVDTLGRVYGDRILTFYFFTNFLTLVPFTSPT